MLESSGMSYEWWGETILTANFVLNRVVIKNKDITPCEGWKGRKPGYAQNSTAYRFLVVKSDSPDVSEDTIIEYRDASFFEEVYP